MARWQIFVGGLVLGATAALGIGFLYTKEYQTFVVNAPYVRAASEAKLDISLLRKLKAGDLAGAAELIDSRLKIHEATLAEYRQRLPRESQDASVLAAAKDIEQFRSEAS